MTREPEASDPGWGEAVTKLSAGTRDDFEAAWFLTRSSFWRAFGTSQFAPALLGVGFFVLVVAIVLLSPSTDSRFIYTDF
jgi:hypothetical protein